MTIGKQMGLCLGGILAACATIGFAGWWYVTALAGRLDESIKVSARQIELAGDLKVSVFTFRLQERGMLLFSHIKAEQQVIDCRDAFDKAMDVSFEKIRLIRPFLRTDRGRALIDQAEAGINQYKTDQLEVRKLLAAGKLDDATQWDKKTLVTDGARVVAALDRYTDLLHSLNAQANAEAAAMQRTAKTVLALGLLGCAVLGFIVIFAVRSATRNLQATADELDVAAREVAGAASQVASSSTALAQAVTKQAGSLEETSAASEEINSMARMNTEKSHTAANVVAESGQKFDLANQTLEQTVTAMGEINEQSGKISKILKVIDDIAFQTNILALNAAVEAARAGEAGMGFAVVADEVRNLAQRCAQAAKDTAQLVEESVTKSNDGKSKVDQVAVAILAITTEALKVKTLVDEVNLGSSEQARGIEQISKTITQMQGMTQDSAASAEESAAAAVQLNAQSESLKRIMQRLTALAGHSESSAIRQLA
jgi:methyl-accepting chemotaxis protein